MSIDYRERAVEYFLDATEASKRGDKELAKERLRVAVMACVYAAAAEADKRQKETSDAGSR